MHTNVQPVLRQIDKPVDQLQDWSQQLELAMA
jgi:hypothetical protein